MKSIMKKTVLLIMCLGMLIAGCAKEEMNEAEDVKEVIFSGELQEYEGKLYTAIPCSTDENIINTNCKWGSILVYDGKVYYTKRRAVDAVESEAKLFRSNLDGTNEELLLENAEGFCIYGGELYCEINDEETVIVDLESLEVIENTEGYIFDADEDQIWKEADEELTLIVAKEPVSKDELKKELKLEDDARLGLTEEFVFCKKDGKLCCYNKETKEETLYEVEFLEDIYWGNWYAANGKAYIFTGGDLLDKMCNHGYVELNLETGDYRLILQWFQP